jgi:hypothetical protein
VALQRSIVGGGDFVEDYIEGKATTWTESGRKDGEMLFKKGVLVEMTSFGEKGLPVAKVTMKAEALKTAQPIRGKEALAQASPANLDSNALMTFYDSAGEKAVTLDPAGNRFVFYSSGQELCTCLMSQARESCCPGKRGSPEMKHALEAMKYAQTAMK